jgi:hypothetical protein
MEQSQNEYGTLSQEGNVLLGAENNLGMAGPEGPSKRGRGEERGDSFDLEEQSDKALADLPQTPPQSAPNYCLCYFLFFSLGNFNNASYVIITAASQDIATRFNQESLVGGFLLALWAFSAAVKVLNSTYWIN